MTCPIVPQLHRNQFGLGDGVAGIVEKRSAGTLQLIRDRPARPDRKMEGLGCAESTVGLVIPTGYSFNLDGTNIYMAMAAVFGAGHQHAARSAIIRLRC